MILYLTFATLWTFLIEFITKWRGEEFNWKERIIHFFIAPLSFLYFIHTLINESFK